MKKIRIAFVETNCKKNGPIKQTWNIIRHMDRGIFEPILITIWSEEENNSMLDEYKKLGIQVFSCNLGKKESIFKGKKAVKQILMNIKPDIVQGVGMPPYRMTLGYKKAIHFITLRNYCYEDYPDQYGKGIGTILAFFDIKLIRNKLEKGDPFVTCSESLTKMYREKQQLEINYIRNGVDIENYTKKDVSLVTELRRKLDIPLDKTVFVYSGGLIERKNQKEAIEAFIHMKNMENAILLFLGDGKDRAELQEKYGKYNKIFFRGKVNNVSEYLHASDIYIATSKSEGLPNGVLEAMACGLPVILSDIPQHLEVLEVDKTCGYAYKLGDVSTLSNIMDSILDKDLNSMGERSYIAVMENFTASGMSEKYQKYYIQMMKEKGSYCNEY